MSGTFAVAWPAGHNRYPDRSTNAGGGPCGIRFRFSRMENSEGRRADARQDSVNHHGKRREAGQNNEQAA